MKNGLENNNTPKPIRPDALDTSPNQLPMSKADIVNSLCQVADYGEDNPHPQVCALMDTQRWLDAHMSYQTLPDTQHQDERSIYKSTEQALQGGVFFELAKSNIKDHTRDISLNIFADDLVSNNTDEQLMITRSNRIYFESWIALQEQVNVKDKYTAKLPITDLISAKHLFNSAHQSLDKNLRREQLAQSLSISLDALGSLQNQLQDNTLAVITTKNLIAYSLHDLSRLGEFNKYGIDAQKLAIEYLWQNTESIKNLPEALISRTIQRKYIDEMEYFRGKYSEEIELNPNKRIQSTPEAGLAPIQQLIGEVALASTLPHAA